MEPSKLDFAPLSRLRKLPKPANSLYNLYIFGIIFPALFITIYGKYVIVISLAILVIFGLILFFITQRRQHIMSANERSLTEFARLNHMTYVSEVPHTDNMPGTLFQPGSKKRSANILSGEIHGFPFRTFEYYYEHDKGRSKSTYDSMVMEITLPRVVPHFVIDSHLENVIPLEFHHSQRIELEGDFHKYFDLYAPDKYSVSALTILAPDAMWAIMEHAAMCDIEIVQNKLYFYWPSPATSSDDYKKIFETTDAVLDKISKKLSRSDIYSTAGQAQIHAHPTARGQRLRGYSVTLGTALLAALGLFLYIAADSSLFGTAGTYLILLLFFIILLVVAFREGSLRRSYLRRYQRDYQVK